MMKSLLNNFFVFIILSSFMMQRRIDNKLNNINSLGPSLDLVVGLFLDCLDLLWLKSIKDASKILQHHVICLFMYG